MPGVLRDRGQAGKLVLEGDQAHGQRPVRGAVRAEQGVGGCRVVAGFRFPAAEEPDRVILLRDQPDRPCHSLVGSTTSGSNPQCRLAATGVKAWSFPTGGPVTLSSPAVADGGSAWAPWPARPAGANLPPGTRAVQQRKDLAIVRLHLDGGRVTEARHCAVCQPHGPVIDV